MGADDKPLRKRSALQIIKATPQVLLQRPYMVVGLLFAGVLLLRSSSSIVRENKVCKFCKHVVRPALTASQDVLFSSRGSPSFAVQHHAIDERPYPYEEKGQFYSYSLDGYDNTGRPGGEFMGYNLSCSALDVSSEIGVQKPWDLSDNLHQVAEELDDHPMVYYTQKVFGATPGTFQLKQVVDASWDRLAGSCILLKDRDVFLCITRIIFHDDARKDHCQISFLRGQIFSKSWIHLENYAIRWRGREIVFPTIFDTGTDFAAGGDVYGPEDPRIIIEEGVDGAEPVIIFNMISEKATWKRAMWLFRPFSQHSSILTIKGAERNEKEKNWAPFFLDERKPSLMHSRVEPSQYIHFVYNFAPLEILKCSLIDGMCDHVFNQDVPEDMVSTHDREWSELRGGTQWVPIPLPPTSKGEKPSNGLQAFLSFPRTHTEQTTYCEKAVYRPELVVMVTNGTDYFLTYVSGPMDFGVGILLEEPAFSDPCKAGRIMILNSIADWDFNARTAYADKTDVMTLAVTVNDATVQAMRLSGILKLIYGLASFQQLLDHPERAFGNGHWDEDVHKDKFTRHSAVALDLRACAEEDARTYVDDHTTAEGKVAAIKEMELKRQQEEQRQIDEAKHIEIEAKATREREEWFARHAEEEARRLAESNKKDEV